jgi:hypothetical protein
MFSAGLPMFSFCINGKLINKQNIKKMKKLLFVALIGTFVACGETSEGTPDTPATDTTTVAPADTTAVDSTAVDSTAAAADTTAK